ncbi:MAG: HAMP domain-containing protein [Actinobacteria bacterium]|nr:HAMP domain-containing protein [Actinomycetota bacterium]
MRLRLGITGKLAIIFVVFGAVLLVGLGVSAYVTGRTGLQEAVTAELLSMELEKQRALERWLTEARVDITAKSASPAVVEQSAILLSAAPGSPEALAAHDRLVAEFRPAVATETTLTDLMFIEVETAEVLVSTDAREEGKFKENLSYFIHGKSEPFVSEVYYSTSLGRPAIAAAAPVLAEDGRVLGVIAGRLDMDILQSLISQRTGLRHSADSYLVNAAGLLVTQPRFVTDPAVLRLSISTVAVQRGVEGNSGVALYDGYRGVPVIGAYRWLPEYRVLLITELDQAEALAHMAAFGRTVAWASGLVLALGAALAFAFARSFTRPILALQTGVQRVSRGDLEHRVAVKSSDEIGRLAVAFNEMAASLEQRTAEHRQAEQRVSEALAFSNTLIESSTLGIAAYGSSGQCVLANEAFGTMVGATQEQVLRQNYNQIELWHESGLLESVREASRSGTETRREILTASASGTDVWLDCRVTPFLSAGESHLLLTIDDISASKQAELTLQDYATRLEQSNRDLQEFAYVASHDLQEPLRKVQAFSDRLVNKYEDAFDETGRDYLRRMHEAGQRMQILINDLLGFSRVSSRAQRFAKVDLNIVARDVVSDLEDHIERVKGRVEVGHLPTIDADPTQMHQLLQNLIGNALRFYSEDSEPLVRVVAEIEGGECRLSVEDNGIGFDMQYLDRIFKPFQRLHGREDYEGSGMGLAICRRVVERHGGSITANSTPGKGATFLVTVPILQSRETSEDDA